MTELQHIALEWMDGAFAVCRLPHDAPLPDWLSGQAGFTSFTRTDRELSIVVDERCVPGEVTAQRGWRLMRIIGSLDFALVGVLARLTAALADAGVSVFAISTYDTDYLLVKAGDADAAMRALSTVADTSAMA